MRMNIEMNGIKFGVSPGDAEKATAPPPSKLS